MKNRPTNIMASGFFSVLAIFPFSAAMAIEPPPDNAQPPSALLKGTGKIMQERVESKADVPFLGLTTATLPDMVADHLALEPGTGVIIRTVFPDSPAQKAGLSVNDIILSIGETAVGSPEALSSAIREREPGDRLAIDLIHKGKPAKVEVTLSERPADLDSGVTQDPMLEGLPKEHADRLRDMIERHLQGGDQNGGLGLRLFPEEFMEEIPDITHPRGLVVPQNRQGGSDGNRLQQSSTIRVMDGSGSIEIKTTNGDTAITVRDEKNETVWSGPWNKEEDKAAAPGGIRERIEKVNSGNGTGFSFRFGKPRKPEPGTLDN